MPKALIVDPKELLARGSIVFPEIPVNTYAVGIADERARYGDDALCGIYEDMVFIREFETMLHSLKTAGAYHGTEFFYAGPAHLSIGQEASAVGQAFLLNENDYIFGSHRGHGEFLAKALSLIRKMPEQKLLQIIEECNEGLNLRVMERNGLLTGDTRKDAKSFVAFSMLSEMLARRPDSTADWAVPCMRSACRSASIRTTRSWAARRILRPVPRCTRRLCARKASSSRIWGTAHRPAGMCGKP